MRTIRAVVTAVAIFTALVAPYTHVTVAENAVIHIVSSSAAKSVIQAIQPQIETTLRCQIAAEFDTAASIKRRIESGESFDVAILTSDIMDTLIKEGKITGASSTPLSRTGIGIGARAGAVPVDVSTPEAIKQTLLNAKSITYAQQGVARSYIDEMLGALGIADALKSKTILQLESARTLSSVADGEAQLVITLISEIKPAKGLELVGPFPPKFQHYVTFTAGVSAQANEPEIAGALIKILKEPTSLEAFKAVGMEPL
jgi:molybdate transport system substrate-binding protein